MHKRIDLLGAKIDQGASKRGVCIGPEAIRFAGICAGIEKLGYTLNDKGNLVQLSAGATSEKLRNYEQVNDMNRRIYESTMQSLSEGAFPILLGGDHSAAAGSVSAVAKAHNGNIGIIWVDAHGDWNNDESSETGNMHGMPFSALCGWGPDCMVDFGQGPAFVDPKKCVQIAGRDIDMEERKRMKAAGVTVFSIDAIDRLGMQEVVRRAIAIASEGTDGIHVSYDIDSVSPEFAPGTGTIVHDGLTAREAFLCMEMFAECDRLLGLDMVEVNPILDERNRTATLASELVLSCLGKTVF
ncbi:MAG: arginase [Clostridia bacterium]|nr:arginase [Clostridia bacterium]